MADDLHVLAGLYAVNALEGEELAAFESHLAGCDDCRRDVAEFHEVAADLATAVAVDPPPETRAVVLARITTTRQDPPAGRASGDGVTSLDERRSSRTKRRNRGRLVAGIAAAVLLFGGIAAAFGVAVSNQSTRADEAEARAEGAEEITDLVASPDARAVDLEGEGRTGIRLVFSPDAAQGALLADDLDPVDPSETYELWAIRDGRPAKVTLFNADDDGQLRATFDGDLAGAEAIAVTVEPAGGSDQPTTDIILQATTS